MCVFCISRRIPVILLCQKSGPSSCRMYQCQNPHDLALHFVHQPVAFVQNQLARAWNRASFSEVRVVTQAARFGFRLRPRRLMR